MIENFEPDVYNSQKENQEEEKPRLLYRAFTVDPEILTVEGLMDKLIPGMPNQEDPTKINDGNELGVYMSTNRSMVETAYAHRHLSIKVPKYKIGLSIQQYLELPQCGVVVEVVTDNLSVRRPEITDVLQGHYNNGFEGDEWIADEIPKEHYKIVRLILSSETTDKEKKIVDVEDDTEEALKEAVDKIKEEFEKRKNKVMQYKDFLEQSDEKIRMNSYTLEKAWEEFQEENG